VESTDTTYIRFHMFTITFEVICNIFSNLKFFHGRPFKWERKGDPSHRLYSLPNGLQYSFRQIRMNM